MKPHVAIGLVEIALVVLLCYHFLLNIENWPVVVVNVPMTVKAVGLELESLVEVLGRNSDVVVGVICVGESVVFTAHRVHFVVVVGELECATEHEMFEEMSEASARGLLVAGSGTYESVDGNKWGGAVAVKNHLQAVVEVVCRIVYHCRK